jgi:hypothetical protein
MECLHCVGGFVGVSNIERAVLSSAEEKGFRDIALLIDALCSRVSEGQLLSCPAACNVSTAIHLRRHPAHVNL